MAKNLPASEGAPSLVQEDPTFHGAKKPTCAATTEPGSRAWEPQLLKPGILELVLQEKLPPWKARAPQPQSSRHLLHLEESSSISEDPAQPMNK